MIIAIKEKDRIVVGYSNTDTWSCPADKDYIDEENVAIRFSKDGKLFACCITNRCSDIFLYDENFINAEITPKNITRNIIPRMKKKLQENHRPPDEDGQWENALVICDGCHLYDIDPLFGFCEADDYVCHGSRVEALKSVLDGTTTLSAEGRILRAVKFTSRFYKESLFPIVITDTKTKTFRYVFAGE